MIENFIPSEELLKTASSILVSTISIWEIGIKVKRDRLVLPLSVHSYAEKLYSVDRLSFVPVDISTWLKNIELAWDHRDPVERTIVATASINNTPLLASDKPLVLLKHRLHFPCIL